MKTFPMSYATRDEAMRLMRAAGMPDDTIGACFALTRQRVHRILGPRPKANTIEDSSDPDAAERLPRELRTWRRCRRLNQREAAVLLGIPRGQATISAWETGARHCSLARMLLNHLDLLDRYEPNAR